MPSKKDRTFGSEHRNFHTPSVFEAMGLHTDPKIGKPHDPHDYTFRNIQKNNTKQSGKTPGSWNEGYDVKTRVAVTEAKKAGAASRTMKRMQSR